MFSIRSIFTAAVALVTLASAIPCTRSTTDSLGLDQLVDGCDVKLIGAEAPVVGSTSLLNVDSVGSVPPSTGDLAGGFSAPSGLGPSVPDTVGPVPRGEANTPGDILNTCHGGVAPIIAEISE